METNISIEVTKKAIRSEILAKRRNCPIEVIMQNSELIAHKLFSLSQWQEADTVYAYMDYQGEVQTKQMILESLKHGKRVALPKVIGREMFFYYIHSFDDVTAGYRGIAEPTTTEIASADAPFVIVPGVAFDRNRNRMGYGGGYYDRYFVNVPDACLVAIAHPFQILEQIPMEKTDIPMDCVITPEGMI